MRKSKKKLNEANSAEGQNPAARKKRFSKRPGGRYLLSMAYTLLASGVISLFLLYGPWDGFRTFLITTAEVTINHKYVADLFYSKKTIDKVMSENKTEEFVETTETNNINTEPAKKNEVKLTEISQGSYKAWMLEISDPSTVFLGVTKYLNAKGQKIPYLAENYSNIVGGINAGGFGDANGYGNGGIPIGLIISEGETLHMPRKSKYNIVGFNKDNVLVLGSYTRDEVENKLNLRDAVEFTPVLIMNGEPAQMSGNGGWGVNPRTAIGQRADGTVVFVVVDGRSAKSSGVTVKTLRDIMVEQGCVNAANLDGGSSSVLYYKNNVVNDPSGSDADGMRFLPNAFLVREN